MNVSNTVKALATALSLCAALLTALPANAAEGLNVGKQFKCQACHVNRLKELKKSEGPTLVDAESVTMDIHGPQDAASTQRMCLSCHDGYVLDSRFVWSEKHTTHPVGVTPPESMNIAMVGDNPALPLNEDGEVYCGTCHLGHPGKDAAANAPTFVRVSRENGELCSNCHGDKTDIAGSPHARVKKTNQPPDFESRGICGRCHAPHDNKGPLMWAKKPKEGKNTPVNSLCGSCHGKKPDPGEHRKRAGLVAASARGFDRQECRRNAGLRRTCATCQPWCHRMPDLPRSAQEPGGWTGSRITRIFFAVSSH